MNKRTSTGAKPMKSETRASYLHQALALALLLLPVATLPAGESAAQRDARMQWWREARFGMFVHWGLYSGLAGTWDGKPAGTKGGMEKIQLHVGVDSEIYARRAIPLFKPTPTFAREWARLAREAGCRYLVFTTKHHDGFALHNSRVSDFDAGSVLNRDLVREIVDAARAEGLRVGFYHSMIDYHHDQYAYLKSKIIRHPLRRQPYPNGERDHEKYIEFLHSQVAELVSNYGRVDVMWWDFSATDFQGDVAWGASELMRLVRRQQPGIIMNNRLFRIPEAGWVGSGPAGFGTKLDPKYGDFITPEGHIPATGLPGVDWETCMTMNTTWGWSDHDHDWKSAETLLRNLVEVASKGGNFLLNISPKGDGSVPAENLERMRVIGAWMKVNGESIYGTTASPFASVPWGRCTRKGMTLYLHVFDWPATGKVELPMAKEKTMRAYLLADPKRTGLTVTGTAGGISITLPPKAPDAVVSVVGLETK